MESGDCVNFETKLLLAEKNALVQALLEYYASPGSYALALGQPVRVFQSLDTVIAWAVGRLADVHNSQDSNLQQAAIFFVQRACFRQENTYYEVMGLGRHFRPDALRVRYRALMSLTHPDKGIVGLPTHAAGRINQAYEVLRDPKMRRDYDLSLQGGLGNPTKSRSVASLSFPLHQLTLKDRVHAMRAKNSGIFRTMLFAMPVVVGGVAVVLVTSQNPSDQLLVAKSTYAEKLELDIVYIEPPKPIAALSTRPNSSAPKNTNDDRLSQNSLHIPSANLNPNLGKTIASAPQESYPPRPRVEEGITLPKVVATMDVAPRAPSSLPASTNTFPVDEVKPVLATVDSNTPLNPKPVSTLQAMPEVKRLNSQLNEARLLVTNLIAALERPGDAEAWQARMKQQGVSGNLLGLALPHLRQSAAIKVDQLVLKEQLENNRLRLNGSVALWLGTSVNQLMPYKYAINAEFKDIESGPVMSRFELKESQ